MKTQRISSPAIFAGGLLLMLAFLPGRNSNAQSPPSAHASHSPGQEAGKPASTPIPTEKTVRYRITAIGSYAGVGSEAFSINNKD
jgi:hypothetical protein